MSPAGVVLGLAWSSGLLLVGGWLLARRPASMAERISPHVPACAVLPGRLGEDRGVGGPSRSGVHAWVRQLGWGAAGAVAGMAVVLAVGEGASRSLPVGAALGAACGVVARRWLTGRRRRARDRLLEAQVPAVADLLALALIAGESLHGALALVGETVEGDLAEEFAAVVRDSRTGIGLEPALKAMAGRCANATVSRLVDSLLDALEQGTSVAELMRASAAEAHEDARRRVLASGGRRDAAMLVPVAVIILPTLAALALLPALEGFRLVAP